MLTEFIFLGSMNMGINRVDSETIVVVLVMYFIRQYVQVRKLHKLNVLSTLSLPNNKLLGDKNVIDKVGSRKNIFIEL